MARVGKISVIKREMSNAQMQTMQGGLAAKGMTRIPGTGCFKFPFKEADGRYRTGLDETAVYIQRISDPLEKELEIKRVIALKEKLQLALGGIDLGPRSQFWNYALSQSNSDMSHVSPAKLMDGDNLFDFANPFQELSFSWLRVHPTIASSYQAWANGEYPADTQFYVVDDEIENTIIFNKKQLINKAVAKFDGMSPDKKKKIARLMGLPVTESTTEEVVYNLVDNLLKETDFKSGAFKGKSTVDMFNRFADMKETILAVKDLVEQAISHSIYREKGNGKIYEGEFEIAKDKDALVKFLLDDDNQEDLMALESKLKVKKIALV